MTALAKKQICISVIVTVHNAEKYLRECLDSVIAQTFRYIEILCMDGGSTDHSPQILREYSEKDDRIRIINDTNTSYGHKVNEGICQARGEYISVLESDDMYEPFMLEKLYEVVERYHPDFANGDYTNFFDVNGRRFGYVTKMYREGDYNCLINYQRQPERFGVIPRYWTGLFKREFLLRENIKMNESPGAAYQDMSFRFLTSVLSSRAYHLDMPLYLYRIDNPGSSMYDSKKTIVIAEEHEFLKQELLKRNITNRFIWHNAYQWKYMDFRGNMCRLQGKYRQELFDRYRQELEKDKAVLNRYRDLGYSQFVSEMLEETSERMAELLNEDEILEQENRERLYRFASTISELSREQKLVVFGCGQRGQMILEFLRFCRERIGCLIDNRKELWNTNIEGYAILSPNGAVEKYPDAFYIVANKLQAQDMKNQLQDLRVCEDRIYIY